MRLALLGDPVDHSLSPAIHTAGLAAAGIEGEYVARRVDEHGMRAAVDEIRYGRLRGANVTMPHKELAFELCERVSEDALRAGAVNTLVGDGGVVWGHNTDVTGLRRLWDGAGFPRTAPVLILGSGGAAAGVVVARLGDELVISGRRLEAAHALLSRTRAVAGIVPWGTAIDGAILVNATPIGMHDERLPDDVLEGAGGLVDLAYGENPTPAVRRAAERGIPVVDGPTFLLAQAVDAFEIWTGVRAPVDAMRRALRTAGMEMRGGESASR